MPVFPLLVPFVEPALVVGFVVGFVVGLAVGLVIGFLAGLVTGFAVGLVFGRILGFGFVVGLGAGLLVGRVAGCALDLEPERAEPIERERPERVGAADRLGVERVGDAFDRPDLVGVERVGEDECEVAEEEPRLELRRPVVRLLELRLGAACLDEPRLDDALLEELRLEEPRLELDDPLLEDALLGEPLLEDAFDCDFDFADGPSIKAIPIRSAPRTPATPTTRPWAMPLDKPNPTARHNTHPCTFPNRVIRLLLAYSVLRVMSRCIVCSNLYLSAQRLPHVPVCSSMFQLVLNSFSSSFNFQPIPFNPESRPISPL